MIIYSNKCDPEIIAEHLFKLGERESVMETLKAHYSIVSIERSNPNIEELIKNYNLSFISPFTLFMHDSNGQYLNNKNLILSKLEGFLEIEVLTELIKANAEKIKKSNTIKNNYNNNNNNNSNNDYYDFDESNLTNTELLEKQRQEFAESEKEVQVKEMLLKKAEQEKLIKKKEYDQKQEMLRKRISSDRKNKDKIRSILKPEPDINDTGKCVIVFRLPDGQIKERRFHKTWQVLELYNYIESLEFLLTEEETQYDLITNFPMKIFSDYEETLESAGLFPNAVLQVREK